MSKTSERKRRGLRQRTALSPRNIVEFSMSESAKQQKRNRSMKATVLKTSPALLGRVVCVAPTKNEAEHG